MEEAPPTGEPSAAKDKKKKKGLKMPEAPPWPLTNTLKTIQLIYADKIKADAVDDACNNDRQNMQEYVDDWFKNQYVGSCASRSCCTRTKAFETANKLSTQPLLRRRWVHLVTHACAPTCGVRYGTGPMNKEAQAKFASTLRKFRDTNPYCNTFGRLWGVFDALDEAWCDYYLEVLSHVIKSPVTHPTEEILLPTKMNMAFMVRPFAPQPPSPLAPPPPLPPLSRVHHGAIHDPWY